MTDVLPAVRYNGDNVPAAGESWPSSREPRWKIQAIRYHNDGTRSRL